MYTEGFKDERYYKNNGQRRGGRYYGKKRFYGGQAMKNKRAISKINNTLKDIEFKFIDTDVDLASFVTTGSVIQGFVIPEGDGQSEREGRKVRIKSIEWRGTITLVSSTVINEGTDTVRLMAVWDKQANKALPAVTDILLFAVQESFKNLEQSGRFITLWDKSFVINCKGLAGDGTTSDTAPASKWFHYYRKLNIEMIYDNVATTGVIATINSNNIVLLVISRLGNAGIVSTLRFRYTDL